MNTPWKDKLDALIEEGDKTGIYYLIEEVGNTRSAKSTVYQLSKKFPEFIWEYKDKFVHAFYPKEEPLKDKALSKWTKGAEERGLPDSWPPDINSFQGDPYSDSLEELADLYNYITVARDKNEITNKQYVQIIQKTQSLYNLIRKSFEVDDV